MGPGAIVSRADSSSTIAVNVVMVDASHWHTYPPGAFFSVDVHVESNDLADSEVVCHWVDSHRQPIGDAIPISTRPRSIRSPSTEPGFYGLVFSSSNPEVAFPPQPAGVPSSVHGFAIIPDPPKGTPEIDEASPFGLVQGELGFSLDAQIDRAHGNSLRIIGIGAQCAFQLLLGFVELQYICGEIEEAVSHVIALAAWLCPKFFIRIPVPSF